VNSSDDKLEIKKTLRGKYLNALYDASDGSARARHRDTDIGANLGIAGQQLHDVVGYLKDEGLLEYTGLGGIIAITHSGVLEVEQAREKPDAPTMHFPPLNIINIGTMTGSQITQGSPASRQDNAISFHNPGAVEEFLRKLKEQLPALSLDADSSTELQADVAALESQLQSSRPKLGIIKECILSVRRILEGAAGKIAADALLQHFPSLMHSVGNRL
jgi:hypothetical protein